jgi:predicted nucleic acid-binding protein
MIVVVNDANILIDLVKLQLLPHFFALNLEFHTSSLILEELHAEQLEQLKGYLQSGTLKVIDFTDVELITIAMMQLEKPALSEQDCSAIVSAQKVLGALITSDNNLRKFATIKKLEVRGHLWVLDLMVEQKTITGKMALEKLDHLRTNINPRLGLPKHECDSRIIAWQNL